MCVTDDKDIVSCASVAVLVKVIVEFCGTLS